MDLLSKLLLLLNLVSTQPDNVTAMSPFGSIYGFTPRRTLRDIFITASGCANESASPSARPPNATVNLTTPENPSTGNCTNNLTNPRSITSATPPADPETPPDEPFKQPIVTFDEWTKEKLKQEQKKMVPPVVTAPVPDAGTPTPTRNYASRECGAKILVTNTEAENTKAILNDKEKDEYMRNPCAKAENKFIVLELCETVQPRQIVLGNFELFSSGPKDIRVLTAERPGADWQLLGNFTAADTRQLQTFNIESRQYAKLIKIELLSHYGNEHYCTLSVLKVMGSSMVDEYEYEANQAETVRLPVQADAVEMPATTVPPPVKSASTTETVTTTTAQPPPATIPETPTVVEPVTTPSPPKNEQKPIVREIVDQVVSGKILKNIVSVVATKLAGEKKKAQIKRYKPFDMTLCQVCPIKPSCIVPTHLCWVFAWRPPSKNSTIPTDSLVLPNRRLYSERRRRRSIAFHQRQLQQKTNFVVPETDVSTEKPAADNVEVVITEENKTEELNQNAPHAAPPVTEAIPAASMSHKESVFMKLNKRIAALELNMSLSSEYLSELSRQYVAQTDEHKKHLEQAKRAAQEMAQGVEVRLNKTITERLLFMRQEMDSLLHSIRTAATELSLSRYVYQMPDKDRCRSEDITALNHYIGSAGTISIYGSWTTEEIMFLLIGIQIFTIIIFCCIVSYMCSRKPAVVDPSEIEKLVQAKVEEILEKGNSHTLKAVDPPAGPAKKKRRKRNRPADAEYPSSDSAVSRTTTTCQTETSSEAESARIAAQQLLDATIRPSLDEKSEEEQPWIPVRRKNSLK